MARRRDDGRTPTRVLWVAKGLGPGGMERLLLTQAQRGDRERYDYSAAYLVDRPHSVIGDLEAAGVPCTRLGSGRGLDLRWLLELRRLVRRERIDVVHVHSPMPAALARPMLRAMRRRPRLVYTEHNSWDCYSAPTRLANAATYLLDDAQVAVSEAAAASPPGPLGHKIEVLVHGIDVDAVATHRSARDEVRRDLGVGDAVVVITVANLRAEKAYDVLLDAAATVIRSGRDVVFLSVGQGPLADEMAQRAETLGLGDRFRFLGFRDDVHDLLAAADLFCFSSRHEGLPVALMEAYAAGLPVVATRVGGLPDVIEDGRSGLLVAPDDPAGLAAAVSTLVDDADGRAAMAARAAELAERFDAASPVRHLEALYRGEVR